MQKNQIQSRLSYSKWLKLYREEFEGRIAELNQKVEDNPKKKRHGKSNQQKDDRNEKLERIKSLSKHSERLRGIQVIIEDENNLILEEDWIEFQTLLETLYENVDNPEHNMELYALYEKLERCNKTETQNSSPRKDTTEKFSRFRQKYSPQPLEVISNLDLVPIDQQSLQYKLKMMDVSFRNMPSGTDYYPPPQKKEKICFKSLLPKYKLITHQIFSKFENETLFYIFYYNKEPYEQYLASRELKVRGWWFHKKYYIWMRKSDVKGPYEQTEQYIKGNFLFFDYEKAWAQKKKQDFEFKFQYLDNEIF